MAGHSKWANIQHRKGRQDAARSKVFTRLSKEITIAAREGGGDPDANPRLRLAIKTATGQSMPKDNIKRALQKGTGEGGGASVEEITFEGYAPGGTAVIVETMTDNRNRTVSDVRSTFGKAGGNLGENGSVMWNFERKGVVAIKTNDKSEEELMEIVLEAGGEDLEYDSESSRVICDMTDLNIVSTWLDDNGFEITENGLEYIGNTMNKVEEIGMAKKVLNFIDKMEDLDDVQAVYTNIEVDDAIAEQL
ncbi:YebC/PmpR family DNA-binding transcriptional regulator [Candidatus Kapabacteria bacterium]|nr:YebC/PmpR family DNA-binding transcriptional regulator [Candidatus Kapabacteria bacterium]